MKAQDPGGAKVMLEVPREFAESLGAQFGRRLPELVTQDSVFDLFGIRPRAYLAMARTKSFPVRKRGRLRVALYDDVRRFLLGGEEGNDNETGASERPAPVKGITQEQQRALDAIARIGIRERKPPCRKNA